MKISSVSTNKCPLCNGEEKYLLTGYDYLYHTTEKIFNVYRCVNCKLEQIFPMPKNSELVSFYPTNYYAYNIYSKNIHKENLMFKIREKLIDLSYNSNSKKDIYYFMALMVLPFFHGLPLKHEGNKKFLDVGCGDAYNVYLMSQMGWNAFGFEVGDKRVYQNIYYDTTIQNVDFGKNLFDYIRVWHTLEHVPNPDEFIRKIESILANDGKILLGLPNTKSLYAAIFGRYWYNRDLPRHVINYNPVNLGILLKKHGLKISKLSYSSTGLLGSMQHMINSIFKSKINLVQNSFLLGIFLPLDMLFSVLKIGDCISLIVEKNN